MDETLILWPFDEALTWWCFQLYRLDPTRNCVPCVSVCPRQTKTINRSLNVGCTNQTVTWKNKHNTDTSTNTTDLHLLWTRSETDSPSSRLKNEKPQAAGSVQTLLFYSTFSEQSHKLCCKLFSEQAHKYLWTQGCRFCILKWCSLLEIKGSKKLIYREQSWRNESESKSIKSVILSPCSAFCYRVNAVI